MNHLHRSLILTSRAQLLVCSSPPGGDQPCVHGGRPTDCGGPQILPEWQCEGRNHFLLFFGEGLLGCKSPSLLGDGFLCYRLRHHRDRPDAVMSRTHLEGTYMCVSHRLGPPGTPWSEAPAEEKTVVACCPRLLYCHWRLSPCCSGPCAVKMPSQASGRVFSTLATK